MTEQIWYAIAGAVVAVIAYWLKRYVQQQDTASSRQHESSRHMREMIENVHSDMTRLRQYVDAEFVRQREMAEYKNAMLVRFTELKSDMDQNFERLFNLIRNGGSP